MSQPMPYPLYMTSPRLPFAVPWSPNPFHFPSPSYQTPPSYPLPFVLSHPPRQNLPPKTLSTHSSYTNTRYNHLKQSTSHINRHRSIDIAMHPQCHSNPNYQYQPIKTKSVSDFHPTTQQNPGHLLKAHSWHAINHMYQWDPNRNYSRDIPPIEPTLPPPPPPPPQHHHPRSPKRKKKSHRHRSASPPQQTPEQGLIRITTLDEMPIINNPVYRDNPTYAYKPPSQSKHFKKGSSPSSTASSQSSFQKRLNGSLRNDPLLIAAMEDFRELRRTSSRSTSVT